MHLRFEALADLRVEEMFPTLRVGIPRWESGFFGFSELENLKFKYSIPLFEGLSSTTTKSYKSYRIASVKRHSVLANITLRVHVSWSITTHLWDTSHRFHELTYPVCWVFNLWMLNAAQMTFWKTSVQAYQGNAHCLKKHIQRSQTDKNLQPFTSNCMHAGVKRWQRAQTHVGMWLKIPKGISAKPNPHPSHEYFSKTHIQNLPSIPAHTTLWQETLQKGEIDFFLFVTFCFAN